MKIDKKHIYLVLFLLNFGMILSCKKESRWDMFKGTGERTFEIRNFSSFTKIYLEDKINVIIKQGNVQEVKVEAGKKLIPLVKTEVSDGVLYIRNDNKCNWVRSYKKGDITIYITMPTLRFIWQYGSGNISSADTITCDTINIQTRESGDIDLTLKAHIVYNQLHGTSDVTLHGRSPLMGIFHIGEGYLYAEEMQTDEIWVYTKASGDEYLNVKNGMTAKLEWAGNIYYKGNPPYVFADVKGNGKLIPLN